MGNDVKGNARIAAFCATNDPGHCKFCGRVGIPILPLRYAVVPSYLNPDQAGLIDPNRFSGAQLHVHAKDEAGGSAGELEAHRYVLRTLRQGVVMVYLGNGLWHAYAVNSAGHLQKVNVDEPGYTVDDKVPAGCTRAGHNSAAGFIHIEPITQGGRRVLPSKIWVAFSCTVWTANTRRKYEGSSERAVEMRAWRMQDFSVEALATQADSVKDAFQLGEPEQGQRRLNELVFEYASDEEEAEKRHRWFGLNPLAIQTKDAFVIDRKQEGATWIGTHGVFMRTGEHKAAAQYASAMVKGRGNMASAIVLNDAIGILHECNFTQLKWLEKLSLFMNSEKVARPLYISGTIQELKSVIAATTFKILEEEESAKTETAHWQDMYGGKHSLSYEKDGLPDRQTVRWRGELSNIEHSISTTRIERAQRRFESLWGTMHEHYREKDRQDFHHYVQTTDESFRTASARAGRDCAKWLVDTKWMRTKEDCDGELLEHQLLLIDQFSKSLEGGPTNDALRKVWNQFLEMDPDDERNPIYTAIFGADKQFWSWLTPEGWPYADKANKVAKIYKAARTVFFFPLKNDGIYFFGRAYKYVLANPQLAAKFLARKHSTIYIGRKKIDGDNPARKQMTKAREYLRKLVNQHASEAVSRGVLALNSALNGFDAGAVTELARARGLQAIQAAHILYEGEDLVFFTVKMPLSEYVAHLNEFGFKTSEAANAVIEQTQGAVRSMVSPPPNISNPDVAAREIEVTLWGDTSDPGFVAHQSRTTSERVKASAAFKENHLRLHPYTISPYGEEYLDWVSSEFVNARDISRNMTRRSFKVARDGLVITAVLQLIVQSWTLRDNIRKAEGTYLADREAGLMVVMSTLQTLAACGELYGSAMKAWNGNVAKKWMPITRISWAIGNLSGLFEMYTMVLASRRTSDVGDNDAAWGYGIAAALFAGSAVLGTVGSLTGAVIMGPTGWGILLMALAIGASYYALTHEDQPVQVWLQRCYWGVPTRYKNLVEDSEIARSRDFRPFGDLNEELSQLNAILAGLNAELGFEQVVFLPPPPFVLTPMAPQPDRLFSRRVKMRLYIPGYDINKSAYEWRLRAVRRDGSAIQIGYGKHGVNISSLPPIRRMAPSYQDFADDFRSTDYRHEVIAGSNADSSRSSKTLTIEIVGLVRSTIERIELEVHYVANTAAAPSGDPLAVQSLQLAAVDD